jgi:hypothetical protein
VQPLSLDRFGEPLHSFPAITLATNAGLQCTTGRSMVLMPLHTSFARLLASICTSRHDASAQVYSSRRRHTRSAVLAPAKPSGEVEREAEIGRAHV